MTDTASQAKPVKHKLPESIRNEIDHWVKKFPEGRQRSATIAALREAQEEIGLIPQDVEFLGRLDDVYSPRGYHIQCFVGRVKMLQPVVNSNEVQELLRVGYRHHLGSDSNWSWSLHPAHCTSGRAHRPEHRRSHGLIHLQ